MRPARVTLLLLLPLLPFGAAEASEAEQLSELSAVITELFNRAEWARTLVRQCSAAEAERAEILEIAFSDWSHRNDAALYEAAITAFAAAAPDLPQQLAAGRARLDEVVAEQLKNNPEACSDLPNRLADDDSSISVPLRRALQIADKFGLEIKKPAFTSSQAATAVLPLAQFSAQASASMAEVGSRERAREDRDLRESREAHLLSWLKTQGPLMLMGRVIGDDELREWRDETQSSFAVKCSSFIDDDAEGKMIALRDHETVLSGDAYQVAETDVGGVLLLHRCRPLTLTEAAVPMADDGPVELVSRPPEANEMRAAPGQGVAPEQMESVLHDATFENRIDGFGNGYVERSEAIYVLLHDGQAWRHDWPFPPSDLDAAASQRREPEKWFEWSDAGGAITLTSQTSEEAAGIDLSRANALVPMPEGALLEATYNYTSIGMMGLQRHQTLAFSLDGTLRHSRDALAGGNVGTSFVTATLGAGAEVQSRYRFENYALVLDGPAGETRHFFASFEGSDPDQPEDVVLNGAIFWRVGAAVE